MLLSDRDLRSALKSGDLEVSPLPDGAIQPASIDLRLGGELATVSGVRFPLHGVHWLPPDGCLLAHTVETIRIGAGLVGRLEGKSTIGRQFVLVHATAGFIDPGFRGQIVLEVVNLSPVPFRLEVGMRISQLSVERLSSPAEVPYGSPGLGSHYQGQRGAVPAAGTYAAP